MYMTESLGDEYKDWGRIDRPDDYYVMRYGAKTYAENVVFLSAPTGTGKTTFVLKVFADYQISQKWAHVLILVPRKILAEQLQSIWMDFLATKETEDFARYAARLQIKTYQGLENELARGRNFEEFDCVVCDKCHYFIEDALFNANTQASFTWLCNFIREQRTLTVC